MNEKEFSRKHRSIVVDTIMEIEKAVGLACSKSKSEVKGFLDKDSTALFNKGVNDTLQRGAERMVRLYKSLVPKKDRNNYDWEARSILYRGLLAMAWSSWVSEAKSRDGKREEPSRKSWAKNHDELLSLSRRFMGIGESVVVPIMTKRKNEILPRDENMNRYQEDV